MIQWWPFGIFKLLIFFVNLVILYYGKPFFQANYVRSSGAGGFDVRNVEAEDWAGECGCGPLPFTTMVQELLNPSGVKLAPCF
jgi:hypothetical protein